MKSAQKRDGGRGCGSDDRSGVRDGNPIGSGGLPADWGSIAIGAVVVAAIAGVVAAVLCWATRRRTGAT